MATHVRGGEYSRPKVPKVLANSSVERYHTERNHQGLGNELIHPDDGVGAVAGKIECRERLGGMLKYYHRNAA